MFRLLPVLSEYFGDYIRKKKNTEEQARIIFEKDMKFSFVRGCQDLMCS